MTQNPSKEDSIRISKGIESYNEGIIGAAATVKDLRYFEYARDNLDKVVGGVRAAAYWNWLHIELLWIDENYRGQGFGNTLLSKAEEFAVDNGFHRFRVETTSF